MTDALYVFLRVLWWRRSTGNSQEGEFGGTHNVTHCMPVVVVQRFYIFVKRIIPMHLSIQWSLFCEEKQHHIANRYDVSFLNVSLKSNFSTATKKVGILNDTNYYTVQKAVCDVVSCIMIFYN